jgi:hypothetical protein
VEERESRGHDDGSLMSAFAGKADIQKCGDFR